MNVVEKNAKLELGRDYVTYEDFGAVGDGKTEDFEAIYKTHEYANAHGLTVKGTAGKTYYIKDTKFGTDTVHSVRIKTNVDWCGAHFIIDDTELTVMKNYPEQREIALKQLFIVESEEEHKLVKIEDPALLEKIAAQGLNQKTKKIDLGIDWDGPVLIIPYNSAHKAFRRRGYTGFEGAGMHEIIVVEKDGTISEETPLMFSYAHIDYIEVYKLDPKSAITIENGVFTTLESRVNHYIQRDDGTFEYIYHGYINRGISVRRSYTTVKNVAHIVTGGYTLLDRAERNLEGAMYGAFFAAGIANHVTFKDCRMQGRTAPGPGGGHSSYDFSANHVNKIVLDGCIQSNFWITIDPVTYEIKSATAYDENAIGRAVKTATENVYAGMGSVNVNGVTRRLCWGLGGTNYCKNMEYLNSTITRFDAHAGLYNGKIINCNIAGMELTGVGDMIIENTNWHQAGLLSNLLGLRSDYGYYWYGDILLKNVNSYMLNHEEFFLASHRFNNWYYGYTTAIPNITVDNMRFFDEKTDRALDSMMTARLFKFSPSSERMHLDDAKVPSIFSVVDYDGDGYIDEPRFISDEDGTFYPARDLDGDGKVGNTSLKYDEYMNAPTYLRGGVAIHPSVNGATHPTCTANLNKTRPPKYFKVVNNIGENGEPVCKYVVKDTSGEGISDGGWYRDTDTPDTMGGFFGGTKFIYGEGEEDYVLGTADNTIESFVFTKEYDT